jgi:hypothetical protein
MSEILSQIIPFNEARFDACMAFISARHKEPLDTYEMVKLHVLIDSYHMIEYGRPVIGGRLEAWRKGPVVPSAYQRIQGWVQEFDRTGHHPDHLKMMETDGPKRFMAEVSPDPEDFTSTELKAMDLAWTQLKALAGPNKVEAKRFFHTKKSHLGRAWKAAKNNGTAIDWTKIIDEYDELHNTDHSHIKPLIRI